MMDIKKEILSRYPASDIEYLEKYIDICSRPSKEGQFHHILPRKLWPKYVNSKKNICVLTPYNHVIAHFYFSKATGALWNAIRWFSGKNNPAKTLEEAKKVAEIYSEFILNYSWSDDHRNNHLKSQRKDKLRELRSKNTKNNWKNPEFKERLLKSRKDNYTKEVRERRSISQSIAQKNPDTNVKRSHSMKELWTSQKGREKYKNTQANQRLAEYWCMPLKRKLFDIWVEDKPKKCKFSNLLLLNHGIKLTPNQLRMLVDEFRDKGFIYPT